MKIWSLYLFGWLTFLSFGANALNLRGFVFNSNGQYYYTDIESKQSYLLKPASDDANEALSKLNNFDTLVGTGSLELHNTVLLETVDFVALRRLIGIWKSAETVVNFLDYTRVNFHLLRDNQLNNYNYALAPADGDSWRIFFTDHSSVVLGSLTVQNSKAHIEVYDPNTGEISQQYDLHKLNPLQ